MSSLLKLTETAIVESKDPQLSLSGTDALNLKQTAILALEQGVWTVISYFAEANKKGALKVAATMECSILSIHEFDWERLIEVYGSREQFLASYRKIENSRSAETASTSVVNQYLSSKSWVGAKLNDADAGKLHCFGIIAGASVALGEVHKLDPKEAHSISEVVGATVYTGKEKFNWAEIDCV